MGVEERRGAVINRRPKTMWERHGLISIRRWRGKSEADAENPSRKPCCSASAVSGRRPARADRRCRSTCSEQPPVLAPPFLFSFFFFIVSSSSRAIRLRVALFGLAQPNLACAGSSCSPGLHSSYGGVRLSMADNIRSGVSDTVHLADRGPSQCLPGLVHTSGRSSRSDSASCSKFDGRQRALDM